jgi:hypothetical protein
MQPKKPGLGVHACNLSTQEAEARRSWVPGQPGPQSEPPSQKMKQNQTKPRNSIYLMNELVAGQVKGPPVYLGVGWCPTHSWAVPSATKKLPWLRNEPGLTTEGQTGWDCQVHPPWLGTFAWAATRQLSRQLSLCPSRAGLGSHRLV